MLAAAAGWLVTRRAFREIGVPIGRWGWGGALASLVRVSGLVWGMLAGGCQATPDVVPTEFWREGRVLFHGALLVLLLAATATDLECYLIPDSVTFGGMLLAVVAATVSGDLQMCHVWVDWNTEIPQFLGPYRPEWMSRHPHLHGLAWSLAGLTCGVLITAAVRGISRRVLGREALGLGDVTLMGMIGSFLGWQASVVVFLLAPLAAVGIGGLLALSGRKNYIPYGPYLALAAAGVVFSWRRIWMLEFGLHAGVSPRDRVGTFALRRLFGDWLSLAVVAVAMVLGLVLLLGLSRLYQTIPVTRTTAGTRGGHGTGSEERSAPSGPVTAGSAFSAASPGDDSTHRTAP
jgi:leader peptidase (prepilin peptidase)/N-methyltransferase